MQSANAAGGNPVKARAECKSELVEGGRTPSRCDWGVVFLKVGDV